MKYQRHCLLAFFVIIFCCAHHLSAQTNCSYVVVATGGYTQAQIDQAFSAANLDSYRKKTVRRTMLFSNGAEIQLLSATELQIMNCPVNGALAIDDNQPLDPGRRFEIHSSGVLLESVTAVYKH
jgi:hypothetical protein